MRRRKELTLDKVSNKIYQKGEDSEGKFWLGDLAAHRGAGLN